MNQTTHSRISTPRSASLLTALRAEAKKSRHGAPRRLAILLALPFPLLALGIALFIPPLGLQFYPWNYWYTLLFPVTLVLISVAVARLDAREGNRALLSSGIPLARLWLAKHLRCWGLSVLSNLVVFAVYTLAALQVPGEAERIPAMLAAALAITILASWIVPVAIILTMRLGVLAGIFVPLVVQLVLGFAWFAVPFWPLFPPVATVIAPTAFLPVLPSAEPASADPALAASLANPLPVGLALGCAILVTAVLTALGAKWFAHSEELR